ncbi:hypothetical protein QGN32_23465 [Mycolicibacterium sp. ND9-15]|uniref:hypothetical protein n=1 Tax=Mycolicibacterium sp. ND9-15 TaxID=3042320 RepID=UPI002DD96799|nr:hypothetical protein [Mycolicibacterium sp. ND9-15]WSE56250.1 hypothetical protein QGN32_23465 [Mycolicibacterium sp. ND9-15]
MADSRHRLATADGRSLSRRPVSGPHRVDDLDAQIAQLAELGIATGEVVVIADLVKVVDVVDPDGNEVAFVQDLGAY